MIIFKTNIRRILKDKSNFIFMFVMPMLLIIFTMGLSTSGSKARIGIADNDKTRFTQSFISYVQKTNKVIMIEKNEIKKMLTQSGADYVLVIPKGFTDNIINNKTVHISGYSIKESNVSVPAKYSINNFLSAAKNIGAASQRNTDKFYRALNSYTNGNFEIEFNSTKDNEAARSRTKYALGFLVMSMLFLGNSSAQLILDDKANKTFYRIFAGPITSKRYMIQNILSFMFVLALQLIIIFSVMRFGFKAYFGDTIVSLFAVFLLFALTCVALGVAITGVSKDTRQAGAINNFITIPLCMIGGCFWNRSIMPDLLIKLSNFVPTTWILRAVEKLIDGEAITKTGNEIVVLLLFTIIFGLLGSWKKADITE